ncbi:glycosyltransferase family 2 protein [soil metagenome]
MITAVVLTRNEARFIAGCLDSLRLVTDDILVIDSRSTDRTAEIAAGMDARVEYVDWQGFAGTRNFALDRCRLSSWLLFVDADERVPPGLARELQATVNAARSDVDGFLIPRRNVICGRIMRAGGWWPDYQLRLMRPGRCRYPEDAAVHEAARCAGTVLALNMPLIHLNYRTWREFFRKQLSYARLAGASSPNLRRRSYLGAPTRSFWRRFVSEQGFLDGLHGLTAAGIIGLAEIYRVWVARRSDP